MKVEQHPTGGPYIITSTDPTEVRAALAHVQERGYDFYHPDEEEPEYLDGDRVRIWLLDRREEFA